MNTQYTNTLTPEFKASLERPYFSAEQKATMPDDGRFHVEEQETFLREHPVTAIYRIAVEGSLTQRGGVVRAVWNGSEIGLKDGRRVNIALEGDEVVYPDGSTASIITGSGKSIQKNGRGIALVGSRLSNGDQIVSTPQSSGTLVEREGVPMGDDFLTEGA